jgi:demethylmenaquinone methyltransferase/2-methoxy-6-polyprenyl-1,4-benzoquinol methylase
MTFRPNLVPANPQYAVHLFSGAAYGYDTIAEVLSFGQYGRWRAALVNAAASGGINHDSVVLDVATGTAGVARHLVRQIGCRVVGLDQSQEMLAAARGKLGLLKKHIQLIEASANSLPFPADSFDGLTFTYLFRYVEDPLQTMRELVRVVKPGGFVGFIEFLVPPSPWRELWRIHTRVVLPTAGLLISKGWHEVGSFLGPSIEQFYRKWDIASLRAMLENAGLQAVEHRALSLGGGLVMWGRKAS